MDLVSELAFPMTLSLKVALLATVGVAVVGIPLAHLLGTRDFPGKSVLETVLMLPMVMPPVVTGYYLLLLIGKAGVLGRVTEALTGTAVGLTFTWQAAVLAAFAIALPLGVTTAASAIASVDRAHADASRILGRSECETAIFVTLPLAAKGILAGLVLSFARALGEFGATIMVAGNIPGRTNTMALEIYRAATGGSWEAATTLVLLFTAVSAGFLLVVSRLTRAVPR